MTNEDKQQLEHRDLLYPWQQDQWQQLNSRYRQNRLPHALLLTGSAGLGKLAFAHSLARWLLCRNNKPADENTDNLNGAINDRVYVCGRCNTCRLMNAGTHPDFLLVSPEEEGKAITADNVRQISSILSLKSQLSDLQIVIISPAEAMNKFAANSLLKTLEEPTPDTLIILVSSQYDRLLPTIRSRCQRVMFTLPETQFTKHWLGQQVQNSSLKVSDMEQERAINLSGGAPLAAMKYLQEGYLDQYGILFDSFKKIANNQTDPVSEAEKWAEVGLGRSITWLYTWVSGMIRLKSVPNGVDNFSVWQESTLLELAQSQEQASLYAFLDHLISQLNMIQSHVNVQLSLEDTLIKWANTGKFAAPGNAG